MDFILYANYYLANKDPTLLLDPEKLPQYSEKTFQTLFKHFVATATTTLGTGRTQRAESGRMSYQNSNNGNDTISERVEALTMNETATWLSLAIIFILVVILITVIVAMHTVCPSTLIQHQIECLADVLVMVPGSDELLSMVHEKGVEGMETSGVKTRLGWFRDRRGLVRWGIKVIGGDVEWVDGPDEEEERNGEAVTKGHGWKNVFARSWDKSRVHSRRRQRE
ncbi:hypothetical protein EK21DRAFT_103043 [Setomelanomma holmii]|uniref:Uncharacterized protein n=1 Tax=Setomelanomma holmii TaxID=210430 RepID=A0A9P4H4U3_9PLEO|nr:hypothetical protein EK21DRAFT_103043 [Setomelanomma holmii]